MVRRSALLGVLVLSVPLLGQGDGKKSNQSNQGKTPAIERIPPELLAIGKVAPDIAGEDLDGKTFKLSDYRGKVVVLDFWGDW